MKRFDIICAIATPPGLAGLSVIRVSGHGCLEEVDKCFKGKKRIIESEANRILYGKMIDEEQNIIDTVLISVFQAPHSYTGEDVVEISCHGGLIVAELILEVLIRKNIRMAEPGEFTKRAFLNQKMDLTQVEAVADLIHSVSKKGAQSAAKQLNGGLTKKLQLLREQIIENCGLLELELDFSNEDVELVDKKQLAENISLSLQLCQNLINSYQASEIARSGYAIGIVGYPNAGKSSLLNALLDKKRAIVSDVPGTTRDYIEDVFYIQSVAFKVFDTAGLRRTSDKIEIEGIQLAESILEQCHMLLVLNDSTSGTAHSLVLMKELQIRYPGRQIILIQNKWDLLVNKNEEEISERVLWISAYTGYNIEKLKKILYQMAIQNQQQIVDGLINIRQLQLLKQTVVSLNGAIESLQNNVSNEFVAIDLREALKYIGEITGDVWNEDILNAVFGKFCIGK